MRFEIGYGLAWAVATDRIVQCNKTVQTGRTDVGMRDLEPVDPNHPEGEWREIGTASWTTGQEHQWVFDSFAFLQQARQTVQQPNPTVIAMVNTTLSDKGCQDFLKTVLNNASTKTNPVLDGGDIQALLSDFLAQKKGGIMRELPVGAAYGSASGRIGTNGNGNGIIHRRYSANPTDQDFYDAYGIVNELPHIAGSQGGWPTHNEYDDYALAVAIHGTRYDNLSRFTGKRFAKGSLTGQPENPFEAYPNYQGVKKTKGRDDPRWSNYVHDILNQLCVVKQ